MAKIPDKAEHQRQFAALDTSARRDIIRSVNRGKPVANRKVAHLAVGVARRQQRFWKRAWIIGPIVGLSSFIGSPEVIVAIVNAVLATIALGVMAWFWYSRARRAEAANLELAASPRGRDRRTGTSGSTDEGGSGPSAGERFRSHLPGRSRASKPDGPETTAPQVRASSTRAKLPAGTGSLTPPPGQRPYKPRGRKRR